MATEILQGKIHSYCPKCSGRNKVPPSLSDIPQAPPFTDEMRGYVNYWEANKSHPRNPKTRRALTKGGRIWKKCDHLYFEYKELQDPEAWRNTKLRKALENYDKRRKEDNDFCRQIHDRAVANKLFVPSLNNGEYTCSKCMGQAIKDYTSHECHMCDSWFGFGGSCSCWTSLEIKCDECKVKVGYDCEGYRESEEDLRSRRKVRLQWYLEPSGTVN